MTPLRLPQAGVLTPALLLDLDVFDANVAAMQAMLTPTSKVLRPHVKTDRTPALALRQLGGAARGVTCSTVGEAEVMVGAGIDDVLIRERGRGPGQDHQARRPHRARGCQGGSRLVARGGTPGPGGEPGGSVRQGAHRRGCPHPPLRRVLPGRSAQVGSPRGAQSPRGGGWGHGLRGSDPAERSPTARHSSPRRTTCSDRRRRSSAARA